MDMAISIQEWFEITDYMPYFTAIFDEEISDLYSWVIPKDNYLLVGAALRPRENTKDKFNPGGEQRDCCCCTVALNEKIFRKT